MALELAQLATMHGTMIRLMTGGIRPARSAFAAIAFTLAMAAGTSAQADAIPQSTLVQFSTSQGTFQIDLFDQVADFTVANFLQYVDAGRYTNTIVHRTQKAATQGIGIVQGGGYNDGGTTFNHIATFNPINLQYKLDNSIGTISMARTADKNSATSEWFINTSDNTTSLGAGNGGGYAVFGQIMAGGMSVANTVVALPQQTVNGFPNVPVQNWSSGTVTSANYVLTNSISRVKTHAAFQNPNTPNDVDNSGTISAADLAQIVNSLLKGGGPHAATTFFGTKYEYVDVTGDGLVSALDAAKVVNYLIKNPPAVQSSLLASPLTAHVPEPSTLSLGAIASLALAGYALRRRAAR
jgi:peptidyl-prolyl cis-trans isomerase A (cyclophilin A)